MLRYALVAFCFQISVWAIAESGTNGEKMQLDVYYESRCPDSRNFLVKQLASKWSTLASIVDIRLIPFGKASFEAKPDGGWSFECQHGPEECSGNILHACGIKYSNNATQALAFTSCLMLAPGNGKKCAETANVDFTLINKCHNTLEGENLVHDYGVETLSLKPSLTFVPWLIMDKAWEENRQWSGLFDLKDTTCKYLNFKPAVCLPV